MELIPTVEQMRKFQGRSEDLSRRLKSEGIEVVGISQQRLDFAEGVPQESQDLGSAILAAWDWDVPPVPAQVTGTQAKLALIDAGLFEAFESWVMQAEPLRNRMRYRVIWEAPNWRRESRELNEITADKGLTVAQVDDLFRLAATK